MLRVWISAIDLRCFNFLKLKESIYCFRESESFSLSGVVLSYVTFHVTSFSEMEQLLPVTEPVGLCLASLGFALLLEESISLVELLFFCL